jgi:general secretion pathway protein N
MRKWSLVLFFGVYISALIVSAPASLLSTLLSCASDERFALANTAGTVWRGSASPVLNRRSGGAITLSALQWEVFPLSFLRGKPEIEIIWQNSEQKSPMEISLAPQQLEIHQAYLPLPASLLDEVSDFLKPAQLRGEIILKSDALILTRQGVQGEATADWLNASSMLSNIAPLGNYRFTFLSSPTGLNIILNTPSGTLLLTGQGQFTTQSGLNFSGTAQAASGKEAVLHELLNHLGPESQLGIHQFNLVPAGTR